MATFLNLLIYNIAHDRRWTALRHENVCITKNWTIYIYILIDIFGVLMNLNINCYICLTIYMQIRKLERNWFQSIIFLSPNFYLNIRQTKKKCSKQNLVYSHTVYLFTDSPFEIQYVLYVKTYIWERRMKERWTQVLPFNHSFPLIHRS